MPPIRMRAGIETSARLAAIGLQIFAPKCALCWTTYAGLFNASWFVATNIHPVWASLAVLSSTLGVCINLLAARRERRYRAWSWTAVSWSCLIAGWLLDCLPVRYLGCGLLAARFTYAGLIRRVRVHTSARSAPVSLKAASTRSAWRHADDRR